MVKSVFPDITKLRVVDLKKLCSKYKVHKTVRKADLQQRLQQYFAANTVEENADSGDHNAEQSSDMNMDTSDHKPDGTSVTPAETVVKTETDELALPISEETSEKIEKTDRVETTALIPYGTGTMALVEWRTPWRPAEEISPTGNQSLNEQSSETNSLIALDNLVDDEADWVFSLNTDVSTATQEHMNYGTPYESIVQLDMDKIVIPLKTTEQTENEKTEIIDSEMSSPSVNSSHDDQDDMPGSAANMDTSDDKPEGELPSETTKQTNEETEITDPVEAMTVEKTSETIDEYVNTQYSKNESSTSSSNSLADKSNSEKSSPTPPLSQHNQTDQPAAPTNVDTADANQDNLDLVTRSEKMDQTEDNNEEKEGTDFWRLPIDIMEIAQNDHNNEEQVDDNHNKEEQLDDKAN